MLIASIMMSSIVCLACVLSLLLNDTWQRNAVLTALAIIYLTWNFRELRKNYLKMHNDKKYYIVNIIVTAGFILLSVISFLVLPRAVYSWLFLVTGLGSFLAVRVPAVVALPAFYIILFTSIFIAPIGLGWVKIKAMERRELREMAPGILEVNPLEQKRDSTEVQTNEIQKTKEKDSLS